MPRLRTTQILRSLPGWTPPHSAARHAPSPTPTLTSRSFSLSVSLSLSLALLVLAGHVNPRADSLFNSSLFCCLRRSATIAALALSFCWVYRGRGATLRPSAISLSLSLSLSLLGRRQGQRLGPHPARSAALGGTSTPARVVLRRGSLSLSLSL